MCNTQSHNKNYIGLEILGINARVAFNDKRLGFARLQALWRSRKLQFRYNFGRERIIGLQAMCRGYLVRKHGSRKFESIVVIQVLRARPTQQRNESDLV